jgi:hypothetical protein
VPLYTTRRKSWTSVSGRPSTEIHVTCGGGSPRATHPTEIPVWLVNSSSDGGSVRNEGASMARLKPANFTKFRRISQLRNKYQEWPIRRSINPVQVDYNLIWRRCHPPFASALTFLVIATGNRQIIAALCTVRLRDWFAVVEFHVKHQHTFPISLCGSHYTLAISGKRI